MQHKCSSCFLNQQNHMILISCSALTSLIINFRALGGRYEITQKKMHEIIETAESDYGEDHDESLDDHILFCEKTAHFPYYINWISYFVLILNGNGYNCFKFSHKLEFMSFFKWFNTHIFFL
jgi:hypothetical protein